MSLMMVDVPIRPERAEAPSPGHALGNRDMSNAPCKGKSFKKNNKGLKIK